MTKYIETRLFILLKLNRIKRTPVFSRIYLWQEMFLKQFITIPQWKDLFFRVHVTVLFSHFYVKIENVLKF